MLLPCHSHFWRDRSALSKALQKPPSARLSPLWPGRKATLRYQFTTAPPSVTVNAEPSAGDEPGRLMVTVPTALM